MNITPSNRMEIIEKLSFGDLTPGQQLREDETRWKD